MLPLSHLLLAFRSAVPAGAAVVAAAVGALVGVVVAAMAGNRYVRTRYGGSPVLASFTAGWAPHRRRLIVYGGALWLVGWTVAFLVGTLTAGTTPYPLQVLATLGAPLAGASAERDYQVTPAGLVRRTPATATVVPWERFEAFAFADDALVLDRRLWTTKLDREGIDEEAVRTALAEHLPERPA